MDRVDTSQQRVSDADRDAATDRLRVAAEEGRLDVDELDERVSAALSARTQADLDGLTADLPTAAPPPPAKPGLWQRADVRKPLIGMLTLGSICTLVWVASGAHGYFWPVWVFVGLGIAVISSVGRALNGGDDHHDGRSRDRDRDRLPPPSPPPTPPS